MLASLLTTLINSTDITQTQQIIDVSSYELLVLDGSITQQGQSVSIDAFFQNQSTIQAIQSVNAQAFTQINATASATQSAQSIAVNSFYYDIGISGNLAQQQQSMSASVFLRIDTQIALTQPSQYMTATAYNLVITAPSPIVVMTRDRILRNIRNRGSR